MLLVRVDYFATLFEIKNVLFDCLMSSHDLFLKTTMKLEKEEVPKKKYIEREGLLFVGVSG